VASRKGVRRNLCRALIAPKTIDISTCVLRGGWIYRGHSGLQSWFKRSFKSFIDLLDNDLFILYIARPVLLAATGRSSANDERGRAHASLFAYLRGLPAPTSVFAGPEDWSVSNRAAGELTQLLLSGVGPAIAHAGGHGYQHQLAQTQH
jgi:hypothetical protein